MLVSPETFSVDPRMVPPLACSVPAILVFASVDTPTTFNVPPIVAPTLVFSTPVMLVSPIKLV